MILAVERDRKKQEKNETTRITATKATNERENTSTYSKVGKPGHGHTHTKKTTLRGLHEDIMENCYKVLGNLYCEELRK